MIGVSVCHLISVLSLMNSLILNDLSSIVKAFYGDIFGEYLIKNRILSVFDGNNLSCRIDPTYFSVFINVLALKYNLSLISVSNKQHSYKVGNLVLLNVCSMNKREFKNILCDFDYELLAEDNQSMYLRNDLLPLIVDKINFVRDRCLIRRFCLVSVVYPNKTSYDIAMLIEKAIAMCKNGWIMDDRSLGNYAWIVCNYEILMKQTSCVRLTYDENMKNSLCCIDKCALCHDNFKNTDVVFHTKCNHLFHWDCSQGLKIWVQRQQKLCCPCCRTIMV